MKKQIVTILALASLLWIICGINPIDPLKDPGRASIVPISINDNTAFVQPIQVIAGKSVRIIFSMINASFIDSVTFMVSTAGKTITLRAPWTDTLINQSFVFSSEGAATLNYTVYRNNNTTIVTQLFFSVKPAVTNNPPVWSPDTVELYSKQGVASSSNCALFASDPESSTLTYAMTPSNPAGFTMNGAIIVSPATLAVGTYYLGLQISDGENTIKGVVKWVVFEASNVVTSLHNDSVVVEPGQALHLKVLQNDTVVSGAGKLLVTEVSQGTHGKAYVVNGEAVVYTPAQGFSGKDSVFYKVNGGRDSAKVRIEVLARTTILPVATVRSATSIGVSWNAAVDAAWYRVLHSYNSAAFSSVCTTSQVSVVDSPLVEGGTYAYRIVACNNSGMSDTSIAVSATTWKSPAITTSPQAVTVAVGQQITLSVVATGAPACTYQWKMDGNDLSGKTEASLSIAAATLADSGMYVVVVTNSVKSVSSASVKVTVLPIYTLTVTCTPAVGGSVAKVKDSVVYVEGSAVKLTATANTGYRFDGWTGDTTVSAGTNAINVAMNKDRAITAKFMRQFTLTLASSATNKGSVNPSGNTVVDSGTTVNIAASANSGFKFKQWSSSNNGVEFGNATSASTTVKLTKENATVQGVLGCVTFAKGFGPPVVYGNLSVAQWNDGSYYIAGKEWKNGDLVSYAEIDKMDINGNMVWAKTFGLTNFANEFTSIRKTTDGFILVGTSDYELQLWKIVPSGTEIFQLGFKFRGIPAFVQQTTEGDFIIGGTDPEAFTPYLIKSYVSGNIVWADTSTFCESGYHIYDGQQTNDGGFVYVGANMPLDIFVVKTTNAGVGTWCQHFTNEYNARSIRQTSDSGYITGGEGVSKCVLLRLNSTGGVVWKSDNTSAERIVTVRQTSDGGFAYAGSTRLIGAGGYDFYLTKTNSNGVITWTHTYGTSNADESVSNMEIANDGGFIIVGSSGADGNNLYVVKTDENGEVQ